MATARERFWERGSFVVVGDSTGRGFPVLTYRGLKRMGRKVVPVDLGGGSVDGEPAVRSIEEIPLPVDAAVLELPREKTADVLRRAAALGIRDVWIHQGTDTPEALEAARSAGVSAIHGSCAVMYVNCTSFHRVHRWLWRALGKY
jgi:predicted CoA-binding protein